MPGLVPGKRQLLDTDAALACLGQDLTQTLATGLVYSLSRHLPS